MTTATPAPAAITAGAAAPNWVETASVNLLIRSARLVVAAPSAAIVTRPFILISPPYQDETMQETKKEARGPSHEQQHSVIHNGTPENLTRDPHEQDAEPIDDHERGRRTGQHTDKRHHRPPPNMWKPWENTTRIAKTPQNCIRSGDKPVNMAYSASCWKISDRKAYARPVFSVIPYFT